MRTGLQRYVSRCSFRGLAGVSERDYLRMRFACFAVPAFADDFAVKNQYASDPRIRVCTIDSLTRQMQRVRHKFAIG
jgi:hypothetical protein